jgi:integrase
MRSGEVSIMRACDIDTTGKVWVYIPADHKTSYRGHQRKIYLGPKAQAIIKPFLSGKTDAFLFSPQDSMLRVFAARHAARKTPLHYGNAPGTHRVRKAKRAPGERYDSAAYLRAVTRGIAAANKARIKAAAAEGIPADKVALIPHWHPHQLRHNAATNLRREYGIEVARIILGHRSAAITEVYAEVDHARAIDVMANVG